MAPPRPVPAVPAMVAVEGIPVAIVADTDVPTGQSAHMVAVPMYDNGNAYTIMNNPCEGQMQVDFNKFRPEDPMYWDQPPHLGVEGNDGILRILYRNHNGPPFSFSALREDNIHETAPPQLKSKGVSDEDWAHWVKLLTDTVNAHAEPPGSECAGTATFLCMAILSLGLLVPRMCKAKQAIVMDQDVRFRDWQEAFNRLYLQPRGIFVKSQSCCWSMWVQGGEGGSHKVRVYRRWLTFAVGPAATRNVQMQPHLHGDIEHYALCGGPDESQCCCHPQG